MIDVNALEKQLVALDKGARKVDSMLSVLWGDDDKAQAMCADLAEDVETGSYGAALDRVRKLRRHLATNGKTNGSEGNGAG